MTDETNKFCRVLPYFRGYSADFLQNDLVKRDLPNTVRGALFLARMIPVHGFWKYHCPCGKIQRRFCGRPPIADQIPLRRACGIHICRASSFKRYAPFVIFAHKRLCAVFLIQKATRLFRSGGGESTYLRFLNIIAILIIYFRHSVPNTDMSLYILRRIEGRFDFFAQGSHKNA